jgi:hypothetical protein
MFVGLSDRNDRDSTSFVGNGEAGCPTHYALGPDFGALTTDSVAYAPNSAIARHEWGARLCSLPPRLRETPRLRAR